MEAEENDELQHEYFVRPQVRRLFRPDPGHMLFDCDLAGADAQVVAWEAGGEELKDAFKQGLNVHNFNGERIWGTTYQPTLVRRKLTWRDECKRGVHGTNYLSGVPNLAATLGWTRNEVIAFQSNWFRLNPGIRDYHRRVEFDLQTRRRVDNKFGYRIIYFDRPSNILPEAVAWLPQSTVGVVCSKGAVRVHKCLAWCTILLQVHDSVVFQVPFHRVNPGSLQDIRRHLEIVIPYSDPLIIPWGLAMSETSWQDVRKRKWEDVL